MLLPEKVGVPLCFPVIKRPFFERQIRKTRHYTPPPPLSKHQDPV